MVIAGVAIGTVAGRFLLPLVWSFKVRNSRSLRVMIPLFTALALGAAGGVMGTTWDVVPVWALFVALVAVTTIDLFHYRIPNAIVFPAVLVLLALMTLISLLRSNPGAIGQAVAAAGLYSGIMAVLHTASRGSLGWGDVTAVVAIGPGVGLGGIGLRPVIAGRAGGLRPGLCAGGHHGSVRVGSEGPGNRASARPPGRPRQPPPHRFPLRPLHGRRRSSRGPGRTCDQLTISALRAAVAHL